MRVVPVQSLSATERADLARLVNLSLAEDHASEDLTSRLSIPAELSGKFVVNNREWGVLAGIDAIALTLDCLGSDATVDALAADGMLCAMPTPLAHIEGRLRDILAAERTFLNFIGMLSGTATMTRRFVDTVGENCTVLDTRKTLPAYRLLQKYAVRCGGGRNHRMHLADGVLLKDNHRHSQLDLASMVAKARRDHAGVEVVVEVDDLAQLENALPLEIDRALLDNFTTEMVARARELRDSAGVKVGLEVSGGVNLDTARSYADAGADFVSVGAITHSAPCWDVGLDEVTT